MSDPLVSILIPTYNGERFLRAALRSALGQSYRNIEVLIGDDASSDGTPGILSSVAAADPRVRVIRHETNLGHFDNPLRLLEASRGQYVKFLLHDDVLATDCVRDLLRGMEAVPEASLAFSRRSLIDVDGRPVAGHAFPQLRDRPGTIDGRELGNAMLESCSNLIGEFTTVLFRRADIDTATMWWVGHERMEVLGDLKVFLGLLARGPAFYTPQTLSRFRSHPAQNSQKPRLIARGVRDWPRLIDWATRQGFLADPEQQRRAFARALLLGASRVDQLSAGQDFGPALEAVFLCTARLVELGAEPPVLPVEGLTERAHSPAALDRLGQELDVWTTTYPVAVAAPRADRAEIEATVQALRDVLAAGSAGELTIAVPVAQADEASGLIDATLAQGPALDVKIVPTDSPADLAHGEWLAVAPRDTTWHEGRASALFAVGPAHSPLPG